MLTLVLEVLNVEYSFRIRQQN